MNNISRWSLLAATAALSLGLSAGAQAQQGAAGEMTFFLTSVGPATAPISAAWRARTGHRQQLAEAAGAGERTWRAYLSAQAAGGEPAVNARDRIGQGPWQNAKGVVIAQDLDRAARRQQPRQGHRAHRAGRGRQRPRRHAEPARHSHGLAAGRHRIRGRGGPDLRQLDDERGRRRCHGGPSRSPGAARRCGLEILELVASDTRRLQPGGAARHRRRRPVLLLRSGLRRSPAPF